MPMIYPMFLGSFQPNHSTKVSASEGLQIWLVWSGKPPQETAACILKAETELQCANALL